MIEYGRYVLVEKIAEGGMGEIFLAKHTGAEGFERTVVVKRMLDALARSKELEEMFLEEARLAASLSHPNIVQITDLGQQDGSFYLCMEYLAGEDLEGLARRTLTAGEKVPVGVAARIALGVLDGLDYAHNFARGGQRLNIVHRDVTPSNVFVTFQGAVKILDFGIARAESRVVKTRTGTLKGKWSFMAPEQARGEEVDARADLFALGLTLFELLTAKRVFERDSELAVLNAVLEDPIPSVRTLRPELPAAIDAVVRRALERDLSRRYASAAAMRQDLEQALVAMGDATSQRTIAEYVQRVCGPLEVQRRTSVPTLSELRAREAQEERAPSQPGLDRTFISGNFTPPRAAAQSPSQGGAPPPPVATPAPAAPAGGGFRNAALAVLLLAAGAGLAAVGMNYLRPPAPPPVAVTPAPPVPAVAVVPQTEPAPVADPAAGPVPGSVAEPEPEPGVGAADAGETQVAAVDPEPEPEPRSTKKSAKPSRPPPSSPLTTKEIVQVVGRHAAKVQGCMETNRSALQGGAGKVSVAITIESSGQVSDAKVTTAGLQSGALADCLTKALLRATFRKSAHPMTVTLPFAYREDG